MFFFDIIYIDCNHAPDYVLRDAILSFKKLNHGGALIFDDYTFSGDGINGTKTGIELFILEYSQKIEKLGYEELQMFIKKFKLKIVFLDIPSIRIYLMGLFYYYSPLIFLHLFLY